MLERPWLVEVVVRAATMGSGDFRSFGSEIELGVGHSSGGGWANGASGGVLDIAGPNSRGSWCARRPWRP